MVSLGPHESAPNGISIGSAVFARLTVVITKDHTTRSNSPHLALLSVLAMWAETEVCCSSTCCVQLESRQSRYSTNHFSTRNSTIKYVTYMNIIILTVNYVCSTTLTL